MEQNKLSDLSKFEILIETGQGHLIGGFSAALTGSSMSLTQDTTSNNCNSTNCALGCGILQNTAKGCGSK